MVHKALIALAAAGIIAGTAALAPTIVSARGGGHGGHGGHSGGHGGHAGHGHAGGHGHGGHGHGGGGHAGAGISRLHAGSGGIRFTGGSISTLPYGYYSCRRWIGTPWGYVNVKVRAC